MKHVKTSPKTLLFLSLPTLLILASGCGILVGNVRPVNEKSETYGVADLSQENKDWQKLDSASKGVDPTDPNVTSTEVADVAYQSKKTASIISINSACRPAQASAQNDNLHNDTNLLFLGFGEVTLREEKPMTLQNLPALQTTVQGKLNGEPMKVRTIVMRRSSCLYDLMYVATPVHFAENEAEFSHFIASLKLK